MAGLCASAISLSPSLERLYDFWTLSIPVFDFSA